MATYANDLSMMQAIIKPIYSHLQAGFKEAVDDHENRQDDRDIEPWFFLHQVRRRACKLLMDDGIQATNEQGTRAIFPLSAIVLYHNKLAIRVMHARPHQASPNYPSEIPSPGTSQLRQQFWAQQTTIPELQTENLLLLWLDDGVTVNPQMTLVRPLGGSNRRSDLRIDWSGKLLPEMTSYQEEDLQILRPENEHIRLLRGA